MDTKDLMSKDSIEATCRLCHGKLLSLFNLKVLGKHHVHYYKCVNCLSMQTEQPYWLEEAYSDSNLSNTDTGAVQRTLHNLAACYGLVRLFKVQNVIDVGGSDGLLCRMLRDYDINCYVKDKYATPTYAQGFVEEDFKIPDLVISFEVLEHFSNPYEDLDALFSYNPKIILLSTVIYANQREDWGYLSPESGQHVFFYSQHAFEMIAKKYGYSPIFRGNYILFVKDASRFRKIAAKLLLKDKNIRLIKSYLAYQPANGAYKDHLVQVERSKQSQQLES
jgi:hypothetical protein